MANHYGVNTLVRVHATFVDRTGAVTDPTVIIAKHQDPLGAEVSKTYPDTIVKLSTGRYYLDIDANAAGTWYYRWEGTGAVEVGGERTFIVDATVF